MIQNQKTQLLIAVLLLFAAGGLFFRQWHARGPAEPMIYFYDQSAEELFAAPQSAVPPIQGIDDQEQDAVRAVVISRTGSRKKDDLEIVYLEKYSPEMKAQFEARKAGAPAEAAGGISRAQSKAHTFVKTPSGKQWHTMVSPEAERIVSDWNTKGPNGEYPLVCTP
ncbi:MAG TPA: hypothetical protein DEW46_01665 [Verrucomicrobia bacterium]|jgi:hypothetical protein|nr:hypothetical protein [Verrucomicrobiota bacterium]